jgi:hypothetical protein
MKKAKAFLSAFTIVILALLTVVPVCVSATATATETASGDEFDESNTIIETEARDISPDLSSSSDFVDPDSNPDDSVADTEENVAVTSEAVQPASASLEVQYEPQALGDSVYVNNAKLVVLEARASRLFGVGSADIHEENYKAKAVSNLEAAHAAASLVIADLFATENDVNSATAALDAALKAMVHDHPVISHSHASKYGGLNGVTKVGENLSIEIKGDIKDVSGLKIDGKSYKLKKQKNVPGENEYFILNKQGKKIGQIEEGSAVVVLPSKFVDTWKNGKHTVTVYFKDKNASGDAVVSVSVKRPVSKGGGVKEDDSGNVTSVKSDGSVNGSSVSGASGSGSKVGDAQSPKTDDVMNVALLAGAAVLSFVILVCLVVALRRRSGDENV